MRLVAPIIETLFDAVTAIVEAFFHAIAGVGPRVQAGENADADEYSFLNIQAQTPCVLTISAYILTTLPSGRG